LSLGSFLLRVALPFPFSEMVRATFAVGVADMELRRYRHVGTHSSAYPFFRRSEKPERVLNRETGDGAHPAGGMRAEYHCLWFFERQRTHDILQKDLVVVRPGAGHKQERRILRNEKRSPIQGERMVHICTAGRTVVLVEIAKLMAVGAGNENRSFVDRHFVWSYLLKNPELTEPLDTADLTV
jgi:hypothetical protein